MIATEVYHRRLSIFILIISPITYFILTRKVVAPFGKHSSSSSNSSQRNWGPSLNPRIAWLIFESPNLLWSIYAYIHRDKDVFDNNYSNVILFSLFVVHYVNRCIVYPMRMTKGSSKVNLSVLSSAFLFCSINGFLQAYGCCRFHIYSPTNHTSVHFRIGVLLWLVGFIVNLQSDSILRNLRKNKGNNTTSTEASSSTTSGTTRYKIPYGGLFEYVSCANFFGEIIEWLGYAIASSSITGWTFWFFVCGNLIPRGIAHHDWYKEKFKETYPKDRYAVIPFIL